MVKVAWPLQEADPRQVGPYRLRGRLAAGTDGAGVVYLAHDAENRSVSVAMLGPGAAEDPAARDRFAAAVLKGRGVADPPEVLSAATSGRAAAWVAVADPRGEGTARAYLEPVAAQESSGEGPGYRPHWSAAGAWAWGAEGGSAAGVQERARWTSVAAVAGVLLVLLLILLLVLFLVAQFLMLGHKQVGPVLVEEVEAPGEEEPGSGQDPSPSPGEDDPVPSPEEVPRAPLDQEQVERLPAPPQGPEDLV